MSKMEPGSVRQTLRSFDEKMKHTMKDNKRKKREREIVKDKNENTSGQVHMKCIEVHGRRQSLQLL